MKKPQVSDCLPSERAFYVSRSMLGNRLDAEFFQPKHYRLLEEMNASSSPVLALYKIAKRVVDGPFGSAIKAEDYTDEGIPFLRVADVTRGEGTIRTEDLAFISHEAHERILRSRVQPGDVVVAKTGATMGVASLIPSSLPEANIRADLAAITLNDPERAQYLVNFINTRMGYQLFWRLNSGATRGRVVIENLKGYPILWPSDEVCKEMNLRIAQARQEKKRKEAAAEDLLATIDEVLLDELGIPRQPEPPNTRESRIFKSSFENLTGQRWDPIYHQTDIFAFVRDAKCELQRLGGKVNYFITGFPAGRGDQADEDDGGIIQIRPTNLSNDRELVFNRNVYIAVSELKTRKSDVLKRGEVLFNNTNSQEQVGKTVWFDLERDYFSSNHITRIGAKTGELDPQYLAYILNLYQRRKVFFKLCTNWNNQSGVGSDVLQRIPIPLPKPMRQAEIVKRLETVRAKARVLREQAHTDIEKAKRDIEALILGKEGVE